MYINDLSLQRWTWPLLFPSSFTSTFCQQFPYLVKKSPFWGTEGSLLEILSTCSPNENKVVTSQKCNSRKTSRVKRDDFTGRLTEFFCLLTCSASFHSTGAAHGCTSLLHDSIPASLQAFLNTAQRFAALRFCLTSDFNNFHLKKKKLEGYLRILSEQNLNEISSFVMYGFLSLFRRPVSSWKKQGGFQQWALTAPLCLHGGSWPFSVTGSETIQAPTPRQPAEGHTDLAAPIP